MSRTLALGSALLPAPPLPLCHTAAYQPLLTQPAWVGWPSSYTDKIEYGMVCLPVYSLLSYHSLKRC